MLDAGPIQLVVRAGAATTISTWRRRPAAGSTSPTARSELRGRGGASVRTDLGLDRRIADNVAQLREGKWNKGEFSKARGIFGRTLGLIGLGRIGQEMVPRARAFGLRVRPGAGAYPPKPRRGSASSAWSLRRRLPPAATSSASTWR